ncbi:MAG: GGDEF domain-containing protein [Pseudomonadota bacterium]
MDVYFQLLNPLVFLIFAIGFVSIHRTKPNQAVFLIATAYLFAVSAFLFDIVHDSLPEFWGDILVVIIYAVGTAILASGIQHHYSGQFRMGLLSLATGIHVCIYSYYMYVENFWLGSFSANIGTAVIFSIGIYGIHRYVSGTLDKILFGICILSILQNIARPIAIAVFTGEPLTQENYSKELFLITLHLSIAVCAVSMAMTLLIIFSREIFNDMRQTSVTDVLTRIRNRRGFEIEAMSFFGASQDRPVCIILADIDHFKEINDTYGHAFGDQLIAEFAELFEQHCAAECIAARIGGEEFAMIVPGKSIHDTTQLAVEIRKSVKESKLCGQDGVFITASFGVAQRHGEEELVDVLSRADDALYASKLNGRDKVTSEMSLSVENLMGVRGMVERRQNRVKFDTPKSKPV